MLSSSEVASKWEEIQEERVMDSKSTTKEGKRGRLGSNYGQFGNNKQT